jgi:type I restriction enzyme R subunit
VIWSMTTKQLPGETYRGNFTEVVTLSVLREQLKVINPWLENDQVEEVIKQLARLCSSLIGVRPSDIS